MQADVKFLKQHPSIHFTIEGHCDERGSIEYNLALGDKRANSGRDLQGARRRQSPGGRRSSAVHFCATKFYGPKLRLALFSDYILLWYCPKASASF